MVKVLITGAGGQLGLELQSTRPAGYDVVPCGSRDLDVSDRQRVLEALNHYRPAVVINAAAYTRVDDAEREAAAAQAVNADGAANVAEAANRVGARMIHISTDFVFDGYLGRPYTPDDQPNPLNVYGRSKLAGERMVHERTAAKGLIVRTAWLYAAQGRNFVRTMLRALRERDRVEVVGDQIGTPTWARDLSHALWAAVERPAVRGILHWTNAGVASWYDFAVAIQEEAIGLGVLHRCVPVRSLRSEEYAALAHRPSFSVLDKTTGWTALESPAPHWRVSLRAMLRELPRD